ncbi:hypothetical protein [Brucella anthropi]|uniref:hypothetical protein n=1 Tax=Brucella anthropi TaxID=529 RepID=UPI000F668258|nr:hypothetical protein [Brucella anthropi]
MGEASREGSISLRIIRGQVDSLSLYEITDYELELLEKGSPSSTYFNFAVFFFSVGVSFLTTLVTVDIESIYVFSVFTCFTIIGLSASTVLFVLWKNTHSSNRALCMKIRARVPTVPANTDDEVVDVINPSGESKG